MAAIRTATKDKAGWLTLAASPTFALMALITAVDAPPLALCAAGMKALPMDGMTAMYFLMSLFHLPAWLNLPGAAEHPAEEIQDATPNRIARRMASCAQSAVRKGTRHDPCAG